MAGSWGEAVLIGTHERADLNPGDDQTQTFHGMLYWSSTGAYYQPLASGYAAVAVSPGRDGRRRLRDRGVELTVTFVGDCSLVAERQGQRIVQDWPTFTFEPAEPRYPRLELPRVAEGLILGRSDCPLRLRDNSVSRQHLKISARGKWLEVSDCGSRNGTVLNGQALKPRATHEVRAGDELVIGNCRYRVA